MIVELEPAPAEVPVDPPSITHMCAVHDAQDLECVAGVGCVTFCGLPAGAGSGFEYATPVGVEEWCVVCESMAVGTASR